MFAREHPTAKLGSQLFGVCRPSARTRSACVRQASGARDRRGATSVWARTPWWRIIRREVPA